MITLITMTGARPDQFRLCATWMKNQTYKGKVTWIIVDDADPVTSNCVDANFRDDWIIKKIYPEPKWKPGENTQARNIAAGLAEASTGSKAIFIIEDDDYYKPIYLTEMVKRIGDYDLIGETHSIYYNVVSRRFIINQNIRWSSLFQVAIKPRAMSYFEGAYPKKFIDLELFANIKNKYLFRAGNLAIGIKGMPGRMGIGAGHERMVMKPDFDLHVLEALIGDDHIYYKEFYKKIDVSEPCYKLKKGVVLRLPGKTYRLSKQTITDERAKEHLRLRPGDIKYFE